MNELYEDVIVTPGTLLNQSFAYTSYYEVTHLM